ncbi:MAG TPA: murein biosynthesis integral membrane protein MurJ [Gaiellaceae bacterium]
MDDAERQREERRLERDRRRRERGKPTHFENAPQPQAERDRGVLSELEAEAFDAEGLATQTGIGVPAPAVAQETPDTGKGLVRSGVIFAVATGLSRIIGLAREIAQNIVFGTKGGPVNAFALAFLIPNTVRALVADSALSAAFVPIFSDLLVKGEAKRAWRVASSLFWLMLLGLGGITALFVVIAPWVMGLFNYGPGQAYGMLAANLARILFPIVIVLGLTGIVVGILNSYDHFTVPALTPIAWNAIILLGLGLGVQNSDLQSTRLYYYAVAILIATIVQFLLPLPWLRGRDDRLRMVIDIHDPAVKKTFVLMLPVAIGIGLINFNALVDQLFASNLLDKTLAPASIVGAFRLYMLPQGVFSVAVATVLFPLLSRHASREDWDAFKRTVATGLRLICFLLIPASAVAAVLATPIVRLLYQHGKFDASQTKVVAPCLAAFALGLTFNGTMLMLNRGFFSLQQPWIPTLVALLNLGVNAGLDAVFYRFGIWGIPLSTSIVNIAGTWALIVLFRRRLGSFGMEETARSFLYVCVASAVLAAVAWWVWHGLDSAFGQSLAAQIISLGGAFLLGGAAFFGACRLLGVRELETLSRLRRRAA